MSSPRRRAASPTAPRALPVADAQRGGGAAGFATDHQRATAETVEQECGGNAGVDLGGGRFDEYRITAGDPAAPEDEAADLRRAARGVGQMRELLGQGGYDPQEPVCHG